MKMPGRTSKKTTPRRPRYSATVEVLEGRALMAASPYSTLLAQSLVTQDYLVFLNRFPDTGGLNGWTGQITSGKASPAAVGSQIANSAESANTFVTGDYRYYLGRTPQSSETNYWVNQLRRGETSVQVTASILGSPEYYNLSGGTNAGFLSNVYTVLLGRPIDSGGASYWANRLAHGQSRESVAYSIETSTEGAQKQVTNAYETVFGRAPDPAGLNTWTRQLSGNSPSLTQQAFLNALINSAENINRINSAIAAGTITTSTDAYRLLTPTPAYADFAIAPGSLSYQITQGTPSTVNPASATFTVTDANAFAPLTVQPVFVPSGSSSASALPAEGVAITDANGNAVSGPVTIQPGQSMTFTVTLNPANIPFQTQPYAGQVLLINGGQFELTPLSGSPVAAVNASYVATA